MKRKLAKQLRVIGITDKEIRTMSNDEAEEVIAEYGDYNSDDDYDWDDGEY